MTIALCTACGSLKFGAWLPCEECGAEDIIPPDVAIYFSDHHWSEETLNDLGRVVRHINTQHRSPKIRALSFLHFVADARPEAFDFRPGFISKWRIRRFLREAELPEVQWIESDIHKRLERIE